MTRQSLLRMFTMLYFGAGRHPGLSTQLLQTPHERRGNRRGRIGLVSSLALVPFVLKFNYGIISDRYNLFGRVLSGAVHADWPHRNRSRVFGAYFVDPSANYGVLATAVLAATFMMALFDTTADALAVDVMEPEDHSVDQAYMTAGPGNWTHCSVSDIRSHCRSNRIPGDLPRRPRCFFSSRSGRSPGFESSRPFADADVRLECLCVSAPASIHAVRPLPDWRLDRFPGN